MCIMPVKCADKDTACFCVLVSCVEGSAQDLHEDAEFVVRVCVVQVSCCVEAWPQDLQEPA